MNKYVLISFILLMTLPLRAQEEGRFFKITYKKIATQINSEKLEDLKKPHIKKQILAIDQYMQTLRYDLLIKNKKSTFQKQKRLQKDGLGIELFAEIIGGGKGVYYFNKKKKELLRQQEQGKVYLVHLDYPKYDWKVHKETKTIAGYRCYRATAEEKIDVGLTITAGASAPSTATRTLEVWFAPSLPGMFGPTEYVGLPGLVLMASGAGATFEAVCVELVDEDISMKKPEGEPITEREFTSKTAEAIKSIRGY